MATQQQIKDSLILEYDQIISELQKQIQIYKADAESLKLSVQSVTDENERLHSDLQNAFQMMKSSSFQHLEEGDDLLRQVRIELEKAQSNDREKSLKLSQYKNDLSSYKKELKVAQQSITQLQEAYDRLTHENQQSLRTAKTFHTDLTSTRDELSSCQKRLKDSTQRNTELQSLLDTTRQQLVKKSAEVTSICMKENSTDQRVTLLQDTNTELESKLLVTEDECTRLCDKITLLEKEATALKEKAGLYESREHVAVNHVKESMQLLEVALAEKEQTDLKEQHYLSEIKHLQKKLSVLLDEAGSRTKQEVDKVRDEYNRNIDIMAKEIEQLEIQCGERQSLIDKLEREKNELNRELDKANTTLHYPHEQVWVKETLNEVRSKLLTTERDRDELMSQLKSLQSVNTKLESNLSEEKHKSSYLEEDLCQQRKQNSTDSQQFRHEIAILTGKCKEFQEQINELTLKLQKAEKEHNKMMRLTQEEMEMKEKELSLKLQYSEETQQKMTLEFKQHMITHQQATNRWQKETSDVHSKFEKALVEMNLKLVDAKTKNKELTSKLQKLTVNHKTVTTKLTDHEEAVVSLSERLSEVEALAEQRLQQVTLLVTREKKALKEKQELHKLLHKTRYQMAQSLNVAEAGILQGHLYQNNTKIGPEISVDELSTISTSQYAD